MIATIKVTDDTERGIKIRACATADTVRCCSTDSIRIRTREDMTDNVLSSLNTHFPTFLLSMAMTLLRSTWVRETRNVQPMYRME